MTFTKTNNVWVGETTSEGKTLFEIERTGVGSIGVAVKISGATKWADIGSGYFGANDAFVVDVPSGCGIRIYSETEVTKASSLVYA